MAELSKRRFWRREGLGGARALQAAVQRLGADRLDVGQEGLVALELALQLVLEEEAGQGDHQPGLGGDQGLGDAARHQRHGLFPAGAAGQGTEGGEHAGHRAEQSHQRRRADADLHHPQVAGQGPRLRSAQLLEELRRLGHGARSGGGVEQVAHRPPPLLGPLDPAPPGLLGQAQEALGRELELQLHADPEHHQGDPRDRDHRPTAVQPDLGRLRPQGAQEVGDGVQGEVHGAERGAWSGVRLAAAEEPEISVWPRPGAARSGGWSAG
jgi:hypothetical protein